MRFHEEMFGIEHLGNLHMYIIKKSYNFQDTVSIVICILIALCTHSSFTFLDVTQITIPYRGSACTWDS